MSKALEIAEQRFAKGEISTEEFNQIKAQLGAQVSATRQDTTAASQESKGSILFGKLLSYLGAIFLVLALGNSFLVLPQERKSASKVEVNAIENRTNIFYIAGIAMFVGGLLLQKRQ